MTHKTDMTDDEAFDRELATLLREGHEETAPLSQAVLSRIATRSRPAPRPLSEVLVAPVPLGAGFALLLAAAALTGYVLMPLSGLTDPVLLLVFSDLIGGGW